MPLSDAEIRAEIGRLVAATPFVGAQAPPASDDDGPPIVEPDEAGTIVGTGDVRPVLLGTDEHRCIREAIEGLARDVEIYQRGRTLVRVTREVQPDDGVIRASGSAAINTLPPATLRERLTRWCHFQRRNDKGDVLDAHPPGWLVAGVDARGEWDGIRPLVGVSDVPILRPDGSICEAAGYDSATGVLYLPTAEFPAIPRNLEHECAWRAAEALAEVVCDFVFESPEHRSAWLAALLTPLGRHAFEGPAPLFLIDANVRGAGKGLLAQTIGRIVSGTEMPVSSYSHDPEELRKAITAIAMAGDQIVLLDNITGAFGNAALDRALTSTRWKDRILGANKIFDGPLLATWYATGNNVQVDGQSDTCRRIIHIRLDVLEERPEERSGFRHPNLLGWIREHRPRLLVEALTILAAYIQAGRPKQGLTPLGSFDGWSDLIREAVVWVGQPDPCLTRNALAESADQTSDQLSEFLAAVTEYDWQRRGFHASDLIRELYSSGSERTDEADRLKAAIENMCGCPPGKIPSARQFGNRLRHFRRRVSGGQFLDSAEKGKHGQKWNVKNVKTGESLYNLVTLTEPETQSHPESPPESPSDDLF